MNGLAGEVLGPASRAVADQLAAAQGHLVGFWGELLSVLAGQLGPSEAAPLARVVAARLANEGDGPTEVKLARTLAVLAGQLRPAESGAIVGPAARAFAEGRVNPNPTDAVHWAEALVALAGQLGSAESGELVGPAARAVADRLAAAQDFRDVYFWAQALTALGGRLGPSEAAPLARLVAARLANERDASTEARLAEALSALGGRLGPSEAAPLARLVAARLIAGGDALTKAQLAKSLSALTGSISDTELLGLIKEHGHHQAIQRVVLSQFERRSTIGLAAAVGTPATFESSSSRFANVWDFAAWAERNRPDLDLTSRPTRP